MLPGGLKKTMFQFQNGTIKSRGNTIYKFLYVKELFLGVLPKKASKKRRTPMV